MFSKIFTPSYFLSAAVAVCALSAPLAQANNVAGAGKNANGPQQPIVELAATASVEVEQDWLEVTLGINRQGPNAQAVQRTIKQAITSTMGQLKTQLNSADEQAMRVRTQNFGVYPRYNNSGKIVQWQAQAQIVISGRDFDRITQAASQVGEMVIEGMHFSLSEAGRERVTGQALQQALATFSQRAQTIAQGLGHHGWTTHSITVDHHDVNMTRHAPRLYSEMASMSKSSSMEVEQAASWVEPGNVRVRVDVNGSVVLKP